MARSGVKNICDHKKKRDWEKKKYARVAKLWTRRRMTSGGVTIAWLSPGRRTHYEYTEVCTGCRTDRQSVLQQQTANIP